MNSSVKVKVITTYVVTFIFGILLTFGSISTASAYYIYDRESEIERNERQDPDYGQPWYNEEKEDKRNDRQDPDHGHPWYDKEAEKERNEKQKPKKNDCDPRCSHGDYCTKYCPTRSPFIDMYVKDYSDVQGFSPFTDRYVQDYSDVRNDNYFTDTYLQDYSSYDDYYCNY